MFLENEILISKSYSDALQLEEKFLFEDAYKIFVTLMEDNNHDPGDIAFHCGWCLENMEKQSTNEIVTYYKKAGKTASDARCRYNSFFRIGWVYLQLKDYRKSAEAFNKVIDISDSFDDSIVQNSMYWCALSLESLGRYIEAIKWYRIVTEVSPSLNPESRRREISCLINIGLYKDALKVCYTFLNPPPGQFNRERYLELKTFAEKEIKILKRSLY